METAVIGVVAVLFVATVAITCILCCFSCDSRTQDPQGGPGRSFTVATFHQEASLFTGPSRHAHSMPSAREFWTFMYQRFGLYQEELQSVAPETCGTVEP